MSLNASINSTCAQPPPPVTAGHLHALSVPGMGHLKFYTAQGPGICQHRGHSQAFDTHAVSYKNITTQKVLLEKKADSLICQYSVGCPLLRFEGTENTYETSECALLHTERKKAIFTFINKKYTNTQKQKKHSLRR